MLFKPQPMWVKICGILAGVLLAVNGLFRLAVGDSGMDVLGILMVIIGLLLIAATIYRFIADARTDAGASGATTVMLPGNPGEPSPVHVNIRDITDVKMPTPNDGTIIVTHTGGTHTLYVQNFESPQDAEGFCKHLADSLRENGKADVIR